MDRARLPHVSILVGRTVAAVSGSRSASELLAIVRVSYRDLDVDRELLGIDHDFAVVHGGDRAQIGRASCRERV